MVSSVIFITYLGIILKQNWATIDIAEDSCKWYNVRMCNIFWQAVVRFWYEFGLIDFLGLTPNAKSSSVLLYIFSSLQ